MSERPVIRYRVVVGSGEEVTVSCYSYERHESWHDFWTTNGTHVAFLNPMEVRKLDDDTPEDPTTSG